MPALFPCPNPSCTYQFDAEQLPAAAMVTCPICKTRFPYRAAERGDESMVVRGEATARINRLVTPRTVPTNNKMQTVMMAAGFALIGITVLAVLIFSSKRSWFDGEDAPTDYADENFNFRLTRFDKSKYRDDPDLRDRLNMNAFFYRRMNKQGDPVGWIGMKCVYLGGGNGIRGPREGELEAELKKILRNFDSLQRDPINAKVGNVPVKGSKFTGTIDDTEVWGEAYAFANKGIGYFMVMWTPRDKWDSVSKELASIRDTFEFATLREKWKDTVSGKPFTVPGADYEVIDTSGLWRRAIGDDEKGPRRRDDYIRNPADEDEKATILFRAVHPDHERKARKDYPADAMVLVLPPGDNTVDAVKKYVHDSLIKKEEGRKIEFTFEPYQKLPFEYNAPATDTAVGSFKLKNSFDNTRKFYGISVKKIGDHAVAVVGWCKEVDSDVMGPLILNLAASLKDRNP